MGTFCNKEECKVDSDCSSHNCVDQKCSTCIGNLLGKFCNGQRCMQSSDCSSKICSNSICGINNDSSSHAWIYIIIIIVVVGCVGTWVYFRIKKKNE